MATRSHNSKQVSVLSKPPQVYVEIPRSPLHMSSRSAKSNTSSTTSLKENTPLPVQSDSSMTSISSVNSRPNKRKLSDASHRMSGREELIASNSKKPRTVALPATSPSATIQYMDEGDADNSEETGSEHFYCHQCNKKRDVADCLQCTMKSKSSKRCRTKYCKACLANRYSIKLDDIKKAGEVGLSKKERAKHISGEGFYFECPRCKGTCNCRECRKAQGLKPTGNLTLLARRAGKESAAQMLADNPSAMGILPGLGRQVVREKKQRVSKKTDTTSTSITNSTSITKEKALQSGISRGKSRAKGGNDSETVPPVAKSKAPDPCKAVPKPTWSRVPTSLTLQDAEMRMNVHEFFHRFSSALKIPQGHLDELDELSGAPIDSRNMVQWVSDSCARSLILGLLTVLKGSVDGSSSRNETFQQTIKVISQPKVALTSVWSSLASLRQPAGLIFPDPLPPPADMIYHATRSGIQGSSAGQLVDIRTSAQLVPVIGALMELALDVPNVHDELEESETKEKKIAKDVREAIVNENARWKDIREASDKKVTGGLKEPRALHKQKLVDLEHAHRVRMYTCMPRFTSLGRDHEGRVYYALSPGAAERDAALQMLEGKQGRRKVGSGISEEDRKEMRRWSWFVAVWGSLPENALKAEDDEDDEGESWWGFWEPEQVKRLAKWIAGECNLGDTGREHDPAFETMDGSAADATRTSTSNSVASASNLHDSRELSPLSELESDDDTLSDITESDDGDDEEMRSALRGPSRPTKKELRALVNNLKQYADLLQWRIQRAKGGEISDKKAIGSVSTKKFYG